MKDHEKTIRILHVIGKMDRGGAEAMIMSFYRSIDKEKIQFDFVELCDEPAAYDSEIEKLGGRIFHSPAYRIINHVEFTKWWNSFFAEHPEYKIIHGHVGSSASIYLGIAKKYDRFTVAHSHSTDAKLSLETLCFKAMTFSTRYIADCFFACSHEAAHNRYGKKVATDSSRCRVIKNAIDTKQFAYNSTKRETMRKKLGLEDKFVIGHVGRMVPEKNHAFLLSVFYYLYKKRSDAVLLLVGDGKLRKNIEKIVDQYGLTNAVYFVGIQENVGAYLQAMDYFVFPSQYEGFGIVLLEAQTSGLRCLGSEAIQPEAKVTELIQIEQLSSGAEKWADIILTNSEYERQDMSSDICNAGYDIKKETEKLTDFYFRAYRE